MAKDALGLPPIKKRLRIATAQSLKGCPVASDLCLAHFLHRRILEPDGLKCDFRSPHNQRRRASGLAGCDVRQISVKAAIDNVALKSLNAVIQIHADRVVFSRATKFAPRQAQARSNCVVQGLLDGKFRLPITTLIFMEHGINLGRFGDVRRNVK